MPYYGPPPTPCNKLIGYSIRDRVPARNSLEELLPIFFFDTTVSDYKIKFVQRGCLAPLIIEYDDLAAVLEISEIKPTYSIVLPEENSLPKEMDLRYLSPANNFQSAQQRYSRHSTATNSVDKETISTFIALDDAYAKEIVIKILIDAWETSKKLKIVLPKKYIYLDPTDIIQFTTPEDYTITARIIEIINNYNTLEITAEFENSSTYTEIKNAKDNYGYFNTVNNQKIPLASNMIAIIMDSYPLNDIFVERYQELNFIYVGTGSFFNNWPGGDIYVSEDNVDFSPAISTNNNAVIGAISTTNNALNTLNNHYYIDKATTIDIVLFKDTNELYSNLSLLELFSSTKNTFFINNSGGGEFIRAQNILSLGNKKYRLSNLLRGLYHSYSNIKYYDYSQNNDVVLVNDQIISGTLEYGVYNNTYYYKAATIGIDPEFVSSRDFYFSAKWAGASPAANIVAYVLSTNIIISWYSTSNFSSPNMLGSPVVTDYRERLEIYDIANNLLNTIDNITSESYTFSPSSVSKNVSDIFIFKIYRYSPMKEYNTEPRVHYYIPNLTEFLSYNSPEILYLFNKEEGGYKVTDQIGTTSSNLLSNKNNKYKNSIITYKKEPVIRIKSGQYFTTSSSTFGSNEYNFTICLAVNINNSTSFTGDIPFITRGTLSDHTYTLGCNKDNYSFSGINIFTSRFLAVIAVYGDATQTVESIYINNELVAENIYDTDKAWTGELYIGNYSTVISGFDVSLEFLSYYNNYTFNAAEAAEIYNRYRELL